MSLLRDLYTTLRQCGGGNDATVANTAEANGIHFRSLESLSSPWVEIPRGSGVGKTKSKRKTSVHKETAPRLLFEGPENLGLGLG